MNDWHLDTALVRERMAERVRRAEEGRLARAAAGGRPPLRLHVEIDLRVSFGRASSVQHPA